MIAAMIFSAAQIGTLIQRLRISVSAFVTILRMLSIIFLKAHINNSKAYSNADLTS